MRSPKVLIIIPAFNEEASIVRTVEGVRRDCPYYDYIVVNDGSLDRTAAVCREAGCRMVDIPVNLGLSGAFQAGMKYAFYGGYDYAVQCDGDGQHNPGYIRAMCEMAERGQYDIVIGSRFMEGKMPFSVRMFGSRIIRLCIRLTTGEHIKDPTSGMRLYSRKVMKQFAGMPNYGPEPDTVAYLIRCGAKVAEYPVHMNKRTAGESYLNLPKSISYMLVECMSILFVQWMREKNL